MVLRLRWTLLSVLPHERYGLDPATNARQDGLAALDHVISFDLAHVAALQRAPGQLVVRLQGVLQVVLGILKREGRRRSLDCRTTIGPLPGQILMRSWLPRSLVLRAKGLRVAVLAHPIRCEKLYLPSMQI